MKAAKISVGIKASIVYTLASIITKGIGVFTLPFFTNVLTKSEIGIANLYSSWYSVLFVVVNLSLCSAAYMVGLKEFKEERDSFTSSLILLSLISTVAFFGIYLLFSGFFNGFLKISTGLMVIMFLSFFVDPAYNFWMARQRFEYKYKSSAIVSILYSILVACVSVLCVYFLKDDVYNLGEVKVASSALVTLSAGLVFTIVLLSKGIHKPTTKYWKFILPLCLPLIVHSIAGQLLSVSDRFMISYMIGDDAVGVYSTLYNISSLALIVWSAINGSLVPFMFEKLDNEETAKQSISVVVVPLFVGFGVIAVALTLVAPEVVLLLTNNEYASAVYIVPPIAAGIFLTAVFNTFGNVISYKKKTKYIMLTTVIACVSNILLNYFLIPIYGFIAAAYTTLFGYIELAVFSYIFSRMLYKRDFINPLFVLGVSSITIVFCLLCNFLYPFTIVRYCIIGVIVILCLVFIKKIIAILRRITEK